MRKFVIALITFLALGVFAQRPPTPRPTLPLDPLTSDEVAQAQRVAQADGRVRELLGAEARMVYVISIAPKLIAKDEEPRGRHADVLYIRRDNEHGVRALVDLAAGRVVDVVRVPAPSVPLGRADVAEALRIAQEDPGLQRLLGARTRSFRVLTGPITRETAQTDFVEGLRHIGAGPEDPCTRNRCVYLLFNSGGRLILTEQEIVVDLNARRTLVRAAAAPRPAPGHGGHE